MKLIDIIRADQGRYTDINIDVNINHGWVSIDDSTGYSESIFLQGDDAIAFITQAKRLYNDLGHVTMGECYHHLAIPYAENLWS